MLLLGLDTSTPIGSVALSEEANLIAEASLPVERTHMERLVPTIDSILKQAGVTPAVLDGIAVGLGPGSFTGTRIALTVARGLAQALNKPLVGIPSLDAITYNVGRREGIICPVVDARRGEVYTASYRFEDKALKRLTPYRAMLPQALVEELSAISERVILVGNGLLAYRDIFGQLTEADFVPQELWFPRASSLIAVALPRFLAGQTVGAIHELFLLAPIYIRRPDAQEPARRG